MEDQRSLLQLAAMEIRDGLVQATTSIEDLRDSLQDARGRECRAINAYGRARLPSWFTWTADQVNHGISASSTLPGHKHQEHLPLSAIVTVGDFSGGELCVEEAGLVPPTKGTRPYTMARVAGPEGQDRVDEDGVALNARNGVVVCSGALHMPAPWRGERYSLVFCPQVGLGKVSWEDIVLLHSLGFQLCAG